MSPLESAIREIINDVNYATDEFVGIKNMIIHTTEKSFMEKNLEEIRDSLGRIANGYEVVGCIKESVNTCNTCTTKFGSINCQYIRNTHEFKLMYSKK